MCFGVTFFLSLSALFVHFFLFFCFYCVHFDREAFHRVDDGDGGCDMFRSLVAFVLSSLKLFHLESRDAYNCVAEISGTQTLHRKFQRWKKTVIWFAKHWMVGFQRGFLVPSKCQQIPWKSRSYCCDPRKCRHVLKLYALCISISSEPREQN